MATQNRQAEIVVISWVFTGIAVATVALKLFARSRIVKVVGWDDFFIFLSLAFSVIAAAFVTYSVHLGLGRHTADILAEFGEDRLILTAKWQILGYPFNIGSFSFPNISIAILLVHLLDPNRLRKCLIYGVAIFQVIFATISVFIVFLQCHPTSKLWDPSAEGTCWSPNILNDFSYWLSAYTTLTDIILAVVPISIFWKLQMPFSTKLGICIMMGLTLLSAIVTVVKATYLHLFTDHIDPLFNVVPLVLWGLIEQNVVIVAACIPTLRPFFNKAFGTKKPTHYEYNSGSGFHLSSKPTRIDTKRPVSISEEPLDEGQKQGSQDYAESNDSQQGIWRTRDFVVESDEDMEPGRMQVHKTRRELGIS